MLRSFESMIDSIAMPSSAKVWASQPWRAAMPSGEGTGQRVYQSTSGRSVVSVVMERFPFTVDQVPIHAPARLPAMPSALTVWPRTRRSAMV